MARKVQVLLVDDLDGTDLGEQGETVAFGFGSERYEIDLSPTNAEKFRTVLGEYVKAGRNVTRIGGSRGTGTRRAATGATRGSSSDEGKAARAWLIEQGILKPESRGRISAENWEKYHARSATAGKAAAAGTAETAQAPDKAPRGNSTTPAKAAAGTSGTPGGGKAEKATTAAKAPATAGVASLLP